MEPNYREILKKEFSRRTERNSFYSLRAFARDLEVSPSRLSEAINGVRGISLDFAKKVCLKIGLDKQWTEIFLTSVSAMHARSPKIKRDSQEKLKSLLTEDLTDHPKTDTVVAWYYAGVLKLIQQGIHDIAKISELLGVTSSQSDSAFRFLKRLGFVDENSKSAYLSKNGKGRELNIAPDQIFNLSQKAILDSRGLQSTHFSLLSLQEHQLIEAKKIIHKCQRDLIKLESNNIKIKSQIFVFTNHLFPLKNNSKTIRKDLK